MVKLECYAGQHSYPGWSHLVRLSSQSKKYVLCVWMNPGLESQISGTSSHSILTTCFILYPGDYPPTGLIAQRINVYRGVGSYKPAAGQTEEAEGDATVSDAARWFGFCYISI